jgi:hypothetical protein
MCMPQVVRARANVIQSLLRILRKRQRGAAERALAQLDREFGVERVLALASTTWIDGAEFARMLEICCHTLGDGEYQHSVHDASILMLKTGVVRAARAASDLFVTPTFGGYVKWTPRIWSLCFQGGLSLEVADNDGSGDGFRLFLRNPPAGKFSKALVLGAAGVLQSIYTLAKVAGQVQVQPFRERDLEVGFRLRKGASTVGVTDRP